MLVLVLILIGALLTGCIDESLLSDEYLDDFEAQLDKIQLRVEDFSRLMTEEERLKFEQRVDEEIFRFSMAFFDELEKLGVNASESNHEAVEALLNKYLMELEEIIDELELAFAPAVSSIRLMIGESQAWVNQTPVPLDQPPTITEAGRTLVPLRFVAESLAAEVNWNDAERRITYTKGPLEIVLYLNETTAMVNGNMIDLGVPPVIVNGRTLVPLRFVSETMGFLVDWQEETREITVIGRLDGQMPAAFTPMELAIDTDVTDDDTKIAYTLLGVIIETTWDDTRPLIALLVDGELFKYEADFDLFETVIEEWDHYSHWGLYEAGFDDYDRVVTLEYGEGVADIVGIFADYYAEKTLADIFEIDGNIVTLTSIDDLLNSEDPDDLPGFSTIMNDQLTPANGDVMMLSEEVVVYVEGDDGIFFTGTIDMIGLSFYDYVELYDTDGDLIYDIVILWLI
ncbi:copper amine oxidase N-terminal domain-containing protein [Anoxynatronum sibiricum]